MMGHIVFYLKGCSSSSFPLLQQLCTISEIANSEEMQEFLALNTDARIAFVKKPFIVSRIDKV